MKKIIWGLNRLTIPFLCAAVSLPAWASDESAVNAFFGKLNSIFAGVLFFDILFFMDGVQIPFAVAWLVIGAIVMTLKMRFINVRAFRHALQVVRGKFTEPGEVGEVSHFAALATALSATVGLGNIAGVAIAISIGGPGATFWMIIAGLLGMSSKFTEVTLALKYRRVADNGEVMGGPMEYLKEGLKEKGLPRLGVFLSTTFAILTIGGSFGGGGSFQVNQSLRAIEQTFPFFQNYHWLYGLILTTLVALVILGGLRRISKTAAKIVPAMGILYVLACLYILGVNFDKLGWAFGEIISGAFSASSIYGGALGVLVVGFQRAAFSNEAGVGSASIAHSAAKTNYPAREGMVALLEPFIDTVVICTMTAMVIVITGAYNNPEYATLIANNEGAALTSYAMGSQVPWFSHVLSISVFLFAFSTIISWSYYGERCFSFVFGDNYKYVYKILLLVVLFLGSITSATNILEFGDLMILGMAIPNILGIYLLLGVASGEAESYWQRFNPRLARKKSGSVQNRAAMEQLE